MARLKGHKANGRGTPQIDRTFPAPVGAIRLACKTHDRAAFAAINTMLTALSTSIPPRYDVLLAIRDRRIAPMHALSLWQLGRLNEVPDVETLPPLDARYKEWLARLEAGTAYKNQIRSTFNCLMALSSECTVGDVAALLVERREQCQKAGTGVSFNRSKAHVQAFVRDVLSNEHALYKAVTRIPTLTPGDVTRRAQTPAQLAAILARLPEPHQSMAWSLAVTGFRPKEYFSRQWVKGGQGSTTTYVRLDGTKTKAASRTVPIWVPGLPIMPERSRDAFEGMWERRIGVEVLGIYDLRRSFSVWMEDATIPRSRRKIYLGHAAGDVTGLYEQRELHAWSLQDGLALWRYAGKWMPTTSRDAQEVEALIASMQPDPDMSPYSVG